MPATEVITPLAIAKELPDDQEPEAVYSWAKQVRNEEVPRAALQKQTEGLRSRRRPPKTAKPESSPAVSPAASEQRS
jgi:hypothetical protein